MQRRRYKRKRKVRQKLNLKPSFIDPGLQEYFNSDEAKDKLQSLKAQYRGVQVLTTTKPKFSWKFFFQAPPDPFIDNCRDIALPLINSCSKLQNAGKILVSGPRRVECSPGRKEPPPLDGLDFAINGASIILRSF